MAGSSGRKPRQRYNTPGVVDGNLARKLDSRALERRLERSGQLDFDQQYRRRRETEAERLSRRRAQAKAAVRPAQRVSFAAVLGFAFVGALMVATLLCYVRINSISRSIVSMKERISVLQVEQVALLTQYEQAFDLSSVKEAAEAAGMTIPSESQIYYIDLPGEDQAVSYTGRDGGLLDRVLTGLSRAMYAVVEYFQ
ncbi:MAG: hypothetical protein HFF65_01665 [Oscillospiraceae bacterium]|jgi:hypothetical protein|nr:hypothetical protein [Oscillospiraceae bacterium]MCI9391088.1 hypothetical protein [Oscillospiraceae bacterium]